MYSRPLRRNGGNTATRRLSHRSVHDTEGPDHGGVRLHEGDDHIKRVRPKRQADVGGGWVGLAGRVGVVDGQELPVLLVTQAIDPVQIPKVHVVAIGAGLGVPGPEQLHGTAVLAGDDPTALVRDLLTSMGDHLGDESPRKGQHETSQLSPGVRAAVWSPA